MQELYRVRMSESEIRQDHSNVKIASAFDHRQILSYIQLAKGMLRESELG